MVGGGSSSPRSLQSKLSEALNRRPANGSLDALRVSSTLVESKYLIRVLLPCLRSSYCSSFGSSMNESLPNLSLRRAAAASLLSLYIAIACSFISHGCGGGLPAACFLTTSEGGPGATPNFRRTPLDLPVFVPGFLVLGFAYCFSFAKASFPKLPGVRVEGSLLLSNAGFLSLLKCTSLSTSARRPRLIAEVVDT